MKTNEYEKLAAAKEKFLVINGHYWLHKCSSVCLWECIHFILFELIHSDNRKTTHLTMCLWPNHRKQMNAREKWIWTVNRRKIIRAKSLCLVICVFFFSVEKIKQKRRRITRRQNKHFFLYRFNKNFVCSTRLQRIKDNRQVIEKLSVQNNISRKSIVEQLNN